MSPVFGHGRLRLYLLKLLDESPRHGYEVIRLLEERFQGLYAPSAGTVYPRLAKLEQEGLVAHSTEGGRKVYRLTDAGRTELAARQGELDELELEIRDSVAQLAGAIREDVRDSAKDLREELWGAAKQAPGPSPPRTGTRGPAPGGQGRLAACQGGVHPVQAAGQGAGQARQGAGEGGQGQGEGRRGGGPPAPRAVQGGADGGAAGGAADQAPGRAAGA
ncbi:PadR family transcriptional regulator [Kitasatospora aburaviensis]